MNQFLNHFPNLNIVGDGGIVGVKEAPTSCYNFIFKKEKASDCALCSFLENL